jgi:hypothetical protein
VEVQLAGGTTVRVDRASEIVFLALPDPYAEFKDNTVLQLVTGTIQITSFLGDEEEFRVDTPSCSVYLMGDGDFRIEASPQGRSRVTSHRGVAEVVGDGGSVLLRAGMHTDAYPGSYPATPEPFNTFTADSFDRWVSERYREGDGYQDGYEYSTEVYEELPQEVQPYYGELSRHGQWVNNADYGYVWHPSGMADSWRPYYDGYWDYGPSGYFWVSYEPWGWAPYHYGRWAWVAGYGWGWIPGRVFAGAWVAWSWGSVHVGWAPLSYWNYPVYVGVPYYYHYDPYCWTFVSYNHIYKRHYPRYAVPVNHVGGGLARTAVVTRPPRVSPRQLANSPEWRTKAARRAAADDRARIKPTYRERKPERNLRDVDRTIARRNPSRLPDRADRPGPGRGSSSPRRVDAATRTSPRQGRGGAAGSTGLGQASGADSAARLKNYPRRLTGAGRTDPRGRSETTRRPAQPTPRNGAAPRGPTREGAGTSTRGQQRQTTDGQSAERVRDLYRKMSGARTTRERAGSPSRPGGSSATPRSGGRSGSGRSQPRTSPRSSSGSRSGGSSAKPRSGGRSGSGGSQPRSSGRSSGSSSRGSSGSRSGGSSGSSGSRSGGKKRGG